MGKDLKKLLNPRLNFKGLCIMILQETFQKIFIN